MSKQPVLSPDPTAMDALVSALNDATQRGDLAGAFGVLRKLPVPVASTVLLRAGYSLGYSSPSEFWADAQRDLAQACARQTDGYGLRSDTPMFNHQEA